MIGRFLPRNFNYYDLFDKQVGFAVEAAVLFKDIVNRGNLDAASAQKMRDIEHYGDEAAHEIINHLNKTFITPFDREDIHTLTCRMDDITDMIDTIVNRLRVYRVTGVDKNLVEFAVVIEQSVRAVALAIKGLHNRKQSKAVMDACVEVNRLENVGDRMRDEMLAELFEKSKDAVFIIKWKEIYQDAETVLDICEDVAHLVESILVKQA